MQKHEFAKHLMREHNPIHSTILFIARNQSEKQIFDHSLLIKTSIYI